MQIREVRGEREEKAKKRHTSRMAMQLVMFLVWRTVTWSLMSSNRWCRADMLESRAFISI